MAKRKDQVEVVVVPEAKGKKPQVQDPDARVKKLQTQFEEAKRSRITWEQYQARWYRKRYGIRPKKTFPWPNCANFHLPLADKNIRKVKPAFVGSVQNVTPVSTFYALSAANRTAEAMIEKEFHWLWHQRMRMFPHVAVAADLALQQGFCIAKTVYDVTYRTIQSRLDRKDIPEEAIAKWLTTLDPQEWSLYLQEKLGFDPEDEDHQQMIQESFQEILDGAEEVRLEYEVKEYDAPRVTIRDPRDIVVPPATGELEQAEVIFDVSFVTERELKDGARSGKYDRGAVREVIKKGPLSRQTVSAADAVFTDGGTGGSESDSDVEKKTGVNLQWSNDESEGYVRIEAYHWDEVKGKPTRQLTVWIVGAPEFPLADESWDEAEWPFTKLFFELARYDHYAPRGVPDMTDSLGTSLVVQHNQMIDRQTLATALSYLYEPGAVQPNAMRFIPGQGIPVAQGRRFEFLTPPQMDQSFDKNQMILKSWAEELIGNPDFGMSGPLNMTRGEARSATEIQSIMQEKQMTQSLDIQVWLDGWRGVMRKAWKLWVEHGPREFTARFGRERIKVNRTGEVLGEFDLEPNGNLWNLNPLVRLQKAESRMNRFAGDPRVNQEILYQDYFREDDERLLPDILNDDETTQKIQQQQAMIQAQAKPKSNGQRPMAGVPG